MKELDLFLLCDWRLLVVHASQNIAKTNGLIQMIWFVFSIDSSLFLEGFVSFWLLTVLHVEQRWLSFLALKASILVGSG